MHHKTDPSRIFAHQLAETISDQDMVGVVGGGMGFDFPPTLHGTGRQSPNGDPFDYYYDAAVS